MQATPPPVDVLGFFVPMMGVEDHIRPQQAQRFVGVAKQGANEGLERDQRAIGIHLGTSAGSYENATGAVG